MRPARPEQVRRGRTCSTLFLLALIGTCVFMGFTLKGARVAHGRLWERLKFQGKLCDGHQGLCSRQAQANALYTAQKCRAKE